MAPRLLDEDGLAGYLNLPLATARRILAGRVAIAGRIRWDRHAVDAWLDEQSGLAAKSAAIPDEDSADAALARYLEGVNGAAGH